jgi:hypothetical protein
LTNPGLAVARTAKVEYPPPAEIRDVLAEQFAYVLWHDAGHPAFLASCPDCQLLEKLKLLLLARFF